MSLKEIIEKKYRIIASDPEMERSWLGKKASFVSPKGDYGQAPYSDATLHYHVGGKKIVQFSLFEKNKKVDWAHVKLEDGTVIDGEPEAIFSEQLLKKYNQEKKVPLAARLI